MSIEPLSEFTGVDREGFAGAEWQAGELTLGRLHDWREAPSMFEAITSFGLVNPREVFTMPTGAEVHVNRGFGDPGVLSITLVGAPGQACPVCHLLGGFHDTEDPGGYHARARARVTGGHPSSTTSKRARGRDQARVRTDAEIEAVRAERAELRRMREEQQ